MKKYVDIVFMDEAFDFLKSLDPKHRAKILYNIRKSQIEFDSELFKKVSHEI